jgi:signal peptidase I
MTYRVLRNDEPGLHDVGLIAVKSPDDDSVPHDAHILVTVRTEGKPFSYLVTRDDVVVGVDPEKFVRSVQTVAPVSVLRRVVSGVLYGISCAIIVALLALGLTGTLAFRVVLTESMKPTINPGDVIVSVSDNVITPKLNDVVVYIATRFDGTPVAPFSHRIIGGSTADGWIVKGDNNPNADVQHPTSKDINAVVIAVWPGVGKFFNGQVIVLLAVLILAIWFIVSGVRSRRDSA